MGQPSKIHFRFCLSSALDRPSNQFFSSVCVCELIGYFGDVRIRIFAILVSGHHIFQRMGTKFPTELKLSNADFVLSGK